MGYHQLPITAYNPPDPGEGIQRAIQLKQALGQQQVQQQQIQAGQLENQQRQMDVQSQQAVMRAYQEAGGDLDKAIPLAGKYGAKPDALFKLREASMSMQKQNMELLNAKGAKALSDADLMQGAHDAVAKAPPEQRAAVYQQQLMGLQRAQVDISQAPPQYPGDEAFQMMGLGLKGHKAQLEELAKQTGITKDVAQTEKDTAQAREATAGAQIKESEAASLSQGGMTQQMADSKYRVMQQRIAAKQPISPDDQNFVKAYEKQKLLVPVASANIRMEGMGKIRQFPVYDNQTKQTVYMDSNEINDAKLTAPGRYTVPQFTAEQIVSKEMAGQTKQITKPLTAFNTAIQHLNVLDTLGADLNNSNVQVFNRAKQRWAKETGNPAPANFQAAANAMSGEVAAALKASGATDQEIAKVGSTFSNAQSPAQLKGAIQTYRQLLNSKRDQLQKQYEAGKQGKPAFDEQGGAGNQPTATHRFNPQTGKIEAVQP